MEEIFNDEQFYTKLVLPETILNAAKDLPKSPQASTGMGSYLDVIISLLYKSPTYIEFSSTNQKFGIKAFKILAKALQQNNTVKRLRFYSCGIDNELAIILFKCLEQNCSINFIDLGWNQIGEVGYRAFIDILSNNLTISAINLYENYEVLAPHEFNNNNNNNSNNHSSSDNNDSNDNDNDSSNNDNSNNTIRYVNSEHSEKMEILFQQACIARSTPIEISFLCHAFGPRDIYREW